jgi:hypothetical protein
LPCSHSGSGLPLLDTDNLGHDFEGVPGDSGASGCRAAVANPGPRGAGRAPADPAAIKPLFNSADILADGRVVFDIGGNRYRLITWINFHYGVVYVRFIGTHRQYDGINAKLV